MLCILLSAMPVQVALAQPAVAPPAASTPTPAPTPKPVPGLSLEEAIRLSLRNSNDAIRIEDEKVNSAAAKLKQASGAFDWTVSGEGGYETLYVPKIAEGLVPNHGVLTDQTDILGTGYISGGVGRTFRDGISIRPGVTAYPSSGPRWRRRWDRPSSGRRWASRFRFCGAWRNLRRCGGTRGAGDFARHQLCAPIRHRLTGP